LHNFKSKTPQLIPNLLFCFCSAEELLKSLNTHFANALVLEINKHLKRTTKGSGVVLGVRRKKAKDGDEGDGDGDMDGAMDAVCCLPCPAPSGAWATAFLVRNGRIFPVCFFFAFGFPAFFLWLFEVTPSFWYLREELGRYGQGSEGIS
jgi:hypothetical protein